MLILYKMLSKNALPNGLEYPALLTTIQVTETSHATLICSEPSYQSKNAHLTGQKHLFNELSETCLPLHHLKLNQ